MVPASWRAVADLSELTCEAGTVGDALVWFADSYPALRPRFLIKTDDVKIAPWAVVCLDEVDVRELAGRDTPIGDGEHEIGILAALMGG
jgi:molybdopterin converting factor small subunit